MSVAPPSCPTVAAALNAFDSEIVDVRPRGIAARGFPEAIKGHARTVGPLDPCNAPGCRRTGVYRATTSDGAAVTLPWSVRPGTWSHYGRAALCHRCAWRIWRREQIAGWSRAR